jgi:hypothetical protein
LVQSEYHWSDAAVLDLTVARLRQIVDNIKDRRLTQFKQRAQLVEWQTKNLAQFIAATVGKEGKALQREAQKISLQLDGDDTDAGAVEGDIEDYDWVEHGSLTALSRNQIGSAERLIGGFRR